MKMLLLFSLLLVQVVSVISCGKGDITSPQQTGQVETATVTSTPEIMETLTVAYSSVSPSSGGVSFAYYMGDTNNIANLHVLGNVNFTTPSGTCTTNVMTVQVPVGSFVDVNYHDYWAASGPQTCGAYVVVQQSWANTAPVTSFGGSSVVYGSANAEIQIISAGNQAPQVVQ